MTTTPPPQNITQTSQERFDIAKEALLNFITEEYPQSRTARAIVSTDTDEDTLELNLLSFAQQTRNPTECKEYREAYEAIYSKSQTKTAGKRNLWGGFIETARNAFASRSPETTTKINQKATQQAPSTNTPQQGSLAETAVTWAKRGLVGTTLLATAVGGMFTGANITSPQNIENALKNGGSANLKTLEMPTSIDGTTKQLEKLTTGVNAWAIYTLTGTNPEEAANEFHNGGIEKAIDYVVSRGR